MTCGCQASIAEEGRSGVCGYPPGCRSRSQLYRNDIPGREKKKFFSLSLCLKFEHIFEFLLDFLFSVMYNTNTKQNMRSKSRRAPGFHPGSTGNRDLREDLISIVHIFAEGNRYDRSIRKTGTKTGLMGKQAERSLTVIRQIQKRRHEQ